MKLREDKWKVETTTSTEMIGLKRQHLVSSSAGVNLKLLKAQSKKHVWKCNATVPKPVMKREIEEILRRGIK